MVHSTYNNISWQWRISHSHVMPTPNAEVYIQKYIRQKRRWMCSTYNGACDRTLLQYEALSQRSSHFISAVCNAEMKFPSDNRTDMFEVYVLAGKLQRKLLVNTRDAFQPGDTRSGRDSRANPRANPAATKAVVRRYRLSLENEGSQFEHLLE